MTDETIEAKAAPRADDTRKWWQWLLMYPTLAVALAGAVPQYGQWLSALLIGVSPGSNVADLKEQHEAWNRNAKCLAQIKRVKPASETTYAIDLLVCPSGDILVTLTPAQNPASQVSKWILTKDLFRPGAQYALVSSAFAADPPLRETAAHATRVIAVKRTKDQIVRRVLLSNNSCEDQTINSYTGRLVSTKRAPCDAF